MLYPPQSSTACSRSLTRSLACLPLSTHRAATLQRLRWIIFFYLFIIFIPHIFAVVPLLLLCCTSLVHIRAVVTLNTFMNFDELYIVEYIPDDCLQLHGVYLYTHRLCGCGFVYRLRRESNLARVRFVSTICNGVSVYNCHPKCNAHSLVAPKWIISR